MGTNEHGESATSLKYHVLAKPAQVQLLHGAQNQAMTSQQLHSSMIAIGVAQTVFLIVKRRVLDMYTNQKLLKFADIVLVSRTVVV